jgi:hypothetical protein
VINTKKRKDIIEFIKCCILPSQYLNEYIRPYIEIALQTKNREDDPKTIFKKVLKKVKEESFINRFIPTLEKEFTHTEIKFLLDFYKSDAGKKFLNAKNSLLPVYLELNNIIEDILKISSKQTNK